MIFAYHGYPYLIHRLTYKRTNHDNIHVRGLQGGRHDDDALRYGGPEQARPLSFGNGRNRTGARPWHEGRSREATLPGQADRAPDYITSMAKICLRSGIGAGPIIPRRVPATDAHTKLHQASRWPCASEIPHPQHCFGAAELFRGEIEKVGIALRLREGCGGRTVIIPRYSCRRNSSTVSLLERPVRLRRVRLGPGERIELLVDMRPNQAGSSSTRR